MALIGVYFVMLGLELLEPEEERRELDLERDPPERPPPLPLATMESAISNIAKERKRVTVDSRIVDELNGYGTLFL